MIDVTKMLCDRRPFDDALDAAIDAAGGPAAFRKFLPYGGNLDTLAAKRAQDRHFNQDDMAAPYLTVWDEAAGFRVTDEPASSQTYVPDGSGPHRLLQAGGVAPLTLSQTVALLKRAAVRLLQEAGKIPPKPDRYASPQASRTGLVLVYLGMDGHDRPVYEGNDGHLYVDTDPRPSTERARLCAKLDDSFDGEPDIPVGKPAIFVPRRATW